jgi:hypothetical protein
MFGRKDIGRMEFEMFEVLDMTLSFTEEELSELRLEILSKYPIELAHLADREPSPVPVVVKTPRSRSPDSGDLPRRKKAKFIVREEDESDYESDCDSDGSYHKLGLDDSPVYPSPPPLSISSSSSSSTSSAITPPESRSVQLVRSRASMNLRAGFNSISSSYSPQPLFSPTIEVPMVEPGVTVESFTKSSVACWQLLQWFKGSPWAGARR